MYTENIFAKHYLSKYKKILRQKKPIESYLTTLRSLLEFILLLIFLKLKTNLLMYIKRSENKNC